MVKIKPAIGTLDKSLLLRNTSSSLYRLATSEYVMHRTFVILFLINLKHITSTTVMTFRPFLLMWCCFLCIWKSFQNVLVGGYRVTLFDKIMQWFYQLNSSIVLVGLFCMQLWEKYVDLSDPFIVSSYLSVDLTYLFCWLRI